MKRFTIFGSRLLFWLLAPWVTGGVLFFPWLAYQAFLSHETTGAIIAVVLALCCLFFLLMAAFPRQLWWLSIFIGGSIAAGYVWYFCETFFIRHQPLKPTLNFAEPTPFNAILGLLACGLPSTLLALNGIRKLMNNKRKSTVRDSLDFR